VGGPVSKSQGRPLRLSHADIVRWRSHVLVTATCHVWMGAVGSDGYGRLAINNQQDGSRMLTPHQVAARLGFGPIPEGATLLHDCEVRLCCRYDPGHVRVGTQAENMQDAVRRGRAVGPRPGRTDVRGKVGASRAIQAALRDAGKLSPEALAAVLAVTLEAGDPWRDFLPLFPVPPARPPRVGGTRFAGAGVAGAVDAAGRGAVGVAFRVGRSRRPVPVPSLPLFEV
jgi:hypothetical protein